MFLLTFVHKNEDRMRLGNKNKILFCIAPGFHYLCRVKNTTTIYMKKAFAYTLLAAALAVVPVSGVVAQGNASKGKKKATVQKRENFEFTWDMPRYVEELKKELTYPMAWGKSGEKDFDRWREAGRKKVFECMMTAPKRASSFDVETVAEERRDGYTARKIAFNVNAYSRIQAYVLIPDGDGPFPAINLLHDHGGHLFIGKEKMVRPFGVDSVVIKDAERWAADLYDGRFVGDFLAKQGYVVFSADAPMWGERGREEGVDRSKYDIIAGNMMMLGRNLCAFMHYDDIACTEMMATLPYVDKENIGAMGCSMGAYRAWMLSALSDNVKAMAAICWMNVTDNQLLSVASGRRENGGFANTIPGLRQYLDYPHIASLACPKATLFINGTKDKLFPEDGVREAFNVMHNVWASQKANANYEAELWSIPHSCGLSVQDRTLIFLDKHLKKPATPKKGKRKKK